MVKARCCLQQFLPESKNSGTESSLVRPERRAIAELAIVHVFEVFFCILHFSSF